MRQKPNVLTSVTCPQVTALSSGAHPAGGVSRHRPHNATVSGGQHGRHSTTSSSAHRPRAGTEVSRRPRQISLDQNAVALAEDAAASLTGSPTLSEGCGKKALPTIFKFPGQHGAREVFLCGSFNNWERIRMNKSTKDFNMMVQLEEGEYEYKFLVDGQWKTDPLSNECIVNGEGIKNSVLKVRKEDFNAFDALDMDSQAVMKAKARKQAQAAMNGSSSLLGQGDDVNAEYTQEIPQQHLNGGFRGSGPPILPPHLLQVILNKDTPLSCEPTLLPEPNHVMLNHLYALSIKDGVMVLSSTHRLERELAESLAMTFFADTARST